MISLRGNYPESLSLAQSEMISSGNGLILSGWSSVANRIYKTGKVGFMSFKQPALEQIEFLQKTKAVHLLIRPSSLRLLLIHIHENAIELPHLKYIWTTSERVDDSLRDLCKRLLKCKLIENYSAGETGHMALQCPDADHLHVMSETHHLEILNAEGKSCAVGQIGRVIVTPLHNFAMPLLRYEIGHETERGGELVRVGVGFLY
jgi:phenylacetate-CoA ligase